MANRVFKFFRELLDVDLTGLSDGDVPTWDAGTSKWVPGTGGGGPSSDDQTAAEVPFTPAGNLAATQVQAALEELDTEKAATSHAHAGEDITSGTVADARIASTIARDSEVTSAISAHEADTTNVHGIGDTSALALTANVQPLDSDLTAIAALTTTAFGRGLLELANQAALLSAAGAAAASHAHAGEDITSGTVADARIASTIARDSEVTSAIAALSSVYQPLDSDLTAIAALTTTSFGRSLLTQADAAATRATLDLEAGTDFPSLTTFNDHSARHEDGGADEISLTGLSGAPADTVNKSLFDANTVLAADSDNTPAAVTMGASTILARLAAGNIKAASTAEIITLLGAYTVGGTDVALADGGTGATLVDPNADRIMFWDDSAGAVTWLAAGTNLTITGTTIDASGTGGGDADLTPAFAFGGY